MSLLSIIRINWFNLLQRKGNLVLAIFGFAGVVFVMLPVLATVQGLAGLANKSNFGSSVIVFRGGAPSEAISSLSRTEQDHVVSALHEAGLNSPVFSASVVPVELDTSSSESSATLLLRGVLDPSNWLGHPKLIEGRWFVAGRHEVVIGNRAARQHPELRLRKTVRWGRTNWQIVGVFSTTAAVLESEAWADLESVQNSFGRGGTVQSIYTDYPLNLSLDDLKHRINQGAEGELEIQRVGDYFSGQTHFLEQYARIGMWALGVYLTICIVLATASIMDTILANRLGQYSVLHAMGYQRTDCLIAVAIEGATLGLVGGMLGFALSFAVFDSVQLSTFNQINQIVFELKVTGVECALVLFGAVFSGAVAAIISGRKIVRFDHSQFVQQF
ncbi:MAG: hypothetical protein NVS3B3_20740 [Aquirhabdus sp.]